MVADAAEVLGQYTIYERLGRGGMAAVNRAEMHGLAGFRKVVALKRLHSHVASDPKMVESFVYEARLASHLHHPNIAQTYDLGKVDKTYFIAMEYVAGPTLTQVLKQSSVAAGPVPIPIALAILGQICDALDYAHNLCDEHGKPLGIIHRDVSPSNIIISNTGVVKLIDFGIAKAAGSEQTKTGFVKGKFAYMAPEYLEGQLDLRADLFGIGVIAHELLTGRSLFLAKSDYDTIQRLKEMPVQPPSRWNPDIPRDLDDIVLTALQRNPRLRWQSAAAMRTAITNVVQSLGGPVPGSQVLEWLQWAFQREPPEVTSSLGRALDTLGEPSQVAEEPAGHGAAGSGAAGSGAAGSGDPSGARKRSRRKTAPSLPRRRAPVARRGSRRVWVLLLVLIALVVLTRDQLEVTGRALYAWIAS
ncbi:MAG TPA: serine/threonine-protein kinase [Kofleriaceae bacterium]|nr:serine/threonine-protein kinase [Kofleriaceae bacterium]